MTITSIKYTFFRNRHPPKKKSPADNHFPSVTYFIEDNFVERSRDHTHTPPFPQAWSKEVGFIIKLK